ncbi:MULTISPECIES: ACP S-malonyltransferase [Aneurinibacillus]|uniref:Malonyl CoA-acyl carrier protein transacylase n=1 Tax=Aneurinibacillus thermoaerophilus TaxID=143495 RepID=A0A1G7WC46_ANETH|nr:MULTISPECIES: ACP S-malonyltransferase [Aneurinibacillus]AMA72632.1 malonyl CoA-ACP transacylase [Aneurinibacillus sp. XH2]MED0674653.1 ACP S-malonyltransferase [Aneurinibacillus thermoaerophilus]MED0680137.1 ACP S-malonyltransferase [Aneurinibacillus thermoaerophilus]MED0736915.1 ACP S-malonyltransferase [Aneurinibacillus thermoaerophilus]MED0756756.1 ACP S-malonyltransferase [Aneurinibacillus thermoaerophilus]
MSKTAFIFPGQGSQFVGMGVDLYEKESAAKAVFDEADRALGFSLSALCFEGPEEKLRLTTNTQPAILTTSVAVLRVLEEKLNVVPDYVAGHSLGEYSALVAAGALSFADAVQIVRARGQYMEEAVPAGQGAMAAVMGMEREMLADVCRKITEEGAPVQLANLNCPGQIVISGSAQGVAKAGEAAKAGGAKRIIPLNVSGPFHSMLMEPATEKLARKLDDYTIQDAAVPVVANVSARPVRTKEDIKESLIQQVASPVLWEDSVHFMLEEGVELFVELGPGTVLSGLVKKVNRKVKTLAIQDITTLEKALAELQA